MRSNWTDIACTPVWIADKSSCSRALGWIGPDKYPTTANALNAISTQQAYVDGELCAVDENGVTSFSLMQAATDNRLTSSLIFFAFDLLYLEQLLKPLLPIG